MTWRSGTQSTGEVIIRYSGAEGIRFFPADLVPLGPNVTSYTDSGPLPDEAYCFLEMSVGGSPPVVSNDSFMGFSDFLCLYTGGQAGSPPRNVTIALNQTQITTLNFSAPAAGGPRGYRITANTFDGAANQVFNLAITDTRFTHDTTGQATCYTIDAMNGPAVVGTAQKLCAVPGIYFAVADEPVDLQMAFDRASERLGRALMANNGTRGE